MTDAEEPDDAFLLAVGAVATGHESLPEAAEKRDVDAEDVARALSRYAHRSDYDGVLWADRQCDDAAMDVRSAAEIAEKSGADIETIEEEIDAASRRADNDAEDV